jgi:hypothetical protein
MATQGHKEEAWRYAEKAMSWSGWGSTVGPVHSLHLWRDYRLYLTGLF